MALKGINNINRNLKLAKLGFEKKAVQGLLMAAALIRRDVDLSPPVVPIDTGNLRGSWFATSGKIIKSSPSFKGKKAGEMSGNHSSVVVKATSTAKAARFPIVILGFSADYADDVHKYMKTGKRPGSGGGFFKSSLDKIGRQLPLILANTM